MRTPFAVKGGGHATNPGFSSTTGVQIAMTRFNQVVVDKTASLQSRRGRRGTGQSTCLLSALRVLDATSDNLLGELISSLHSLLVFLLTSPIQLRWCLAKRSC
jgi:hypothetical protein